MSGMPERAEVEVDYMIRKDDMIKNESNAGREGVELIQ